MVFKQQMPRAVKQITMCDHEFIDVGDEESSVVVCVKCGGKE